MICFSDGSTNHVGGFVRTGGTTRDERQNGQNDILHKTTIFSACLVSGYQVFAVCALARIPVRFVASDNRMPVSWSGCFCPGHRPDVSPRKLLWILNYWAKPILHYDQEDCPAVPLQLGSWDRRADNPMLERQPFTTASRHRNQASGNTP